jgi:hypothetical protein
MADNVTLNAGTGGASVRAVDKGGIETQVVTLDLGGGGAESLIAGAMPVTGTFWQSTQPISGTVTANAGTGTMAVSAASLPLPTGAATAAKQPALGTAGTPSVDVLTVQGAASMTALKVDGSGVTQPVSLAGSIAVTQATAASLNATVVGTGTFAVQASQSGNWSVRNQDGSGNALTSLLVGSQRAIAVAIVDGSGSQVTSFGGAGGTASNFGSTFPAAGTAIGAKDSSGANMAALNLDASGNLKVNVSAGGGSGGTSSSFAAAFPATGTAAGFSDGTNQQGARVFDLDSGAGTEYSLGVGLRLSASGGSVEAGTSAHPLRTDPTGTTTQPISGTVTANAGTGTMAVSGTFWQATQPVSAASLPLPTGAATAAKQPALGTAGTASTDVLSIQGIASMVALKVDGSAVTQPISAASLPLPSGAATSAKQPALGTAGSPSTDVLTVQGAASMTALKVDGSAATQPISGTVTATPAAATSGGATPYKLISAASTNASSVKASAGTLYSLSAFNTNASARYLKLYDKASSPTVGTDTPVMTMLIPPSNGGFIHHLPVGMAFSAGIALAITGAMADSDTTAIGANDVCVNLGYK